jgi:nitrogenase molybdenum-iron protein alpha/beta subunit
MHVCLGDWLQGVGPLHTPVRVTHGSDGAELELSVQVRASQQEVSDVKTTHMTCQELATGKGAHKARKMHNVLKLWLEPTHIVCVFLLCCPPLPARSPSCARTQVWV